MVTLLQGHTANQAILVPHAQTVTTAVAAILQALPSTNPSAASSQALPSTNIPAASSQASQVLPTASDTELPLQQYRRAAALLAKRSTQLSKSALSAELQAQAESSDEVRPEADSSDDSGASAAAAQHAGQASLAKQDSTHTSAHASQGSSEASSSSGQHQQHLDLAIQLKQACYSLLLFLPAAELQRRGQFLVQHAAGMPFLMRCILATAITYESRVGILPLLCHFMVVRRSNVES